MKRSLFASAAIVAAIAASPSHALFNNGGFENGNLDGWSVRWGKAVGNSTGSARTITWHGHINWDGVTDGDTNDVDNPLRAAAVDSNATTNSYYPDYRKVQAGAWQALLNYNPDRLQQTGGYTPETWLQGNYDITEIKQKDEVDSSDISTINDSTGYRVFAYWKAMMENPSGHDSIDRPSFNITLSVKKAGTSDWTIVKAEYHSAYQGATNGWMATTTNRTGEPIYYKDTSYQVDVDLGDSVEIDLQVLDCGLGAHGAFAYLDQVGSQPPVIPTDSPMIGDPCLYATQNLSIGDRTKIHGNVGGGQNLWFGTDIRNSGTVFSGAVGYFGDRDTITGMTYYKGTFTKGNNVVGAATTFEPMLTFASIPTVSVTPGTQDIGFWGTTTLTPGSYGALQGTGTLKLSTGSYHFRNINIYSGATIIFDNTNGPISIYSQGGIALDNFKDSLYLTPGSADLQSRAVSWYTNGDLNLYAGTQPLLGYFSAPNGTATVSSRPIQGYLHARNVTVNAATTLTCTDSY